MFRMTGGGGRNNRQPCGPPGVEASDHVGAAVEADAAPRVSCQAGGVAAFAQHDPSDLRVDGFGDPGRAGGVEAPFEVVSFDDERASDSPAPRRWNCGRVSTMVDV